MSEILREISLALSLSAIIISIVAMIISRR